MKLLGGIRVYCVLFNKKIKVLNIFRILRLRTETTCRIFLSSIPFDSYPISLLSRGHKVVCEAPLGFRSVIVATVNEIDPSEFETMERPAIFLKMLKCLLIFHAVAKSRNKYNPVGWNSTYDFNSSDFLCAKTFLKLFVVNCNTLDWTALKYVTSYIVYGGRVTDNMDQRCLSCLIDQVYNETHYESANFVQGYPAQYYEGSLITFQDLQRYVQRIPEVEDFLVCGMDLNASVSLETRLSADFVRSVKNFNATSTENENTSGMHQPLDVYNEARLKVEEILSHTPQNLISISEYALQDANNPLEIILVHEIERYNNLFNTISTVLDKLLQSVRNIFFSLLLKCCACIQNPLLLNM